MPWRGWGLAGWSLCRTRRAPGGGAKGVERDAGVGLGGNSEALAGEAAGPPGRGVGMDGGGGAPSIPEARVPALENMPCWIRAPYVTYVTFAAGVPRALAVGGAVADVLDTDTWAFPRLSRGTTGASDVGAISPDGTRGTKSVLTGSAGPGTA